MGTVLISRTLWKCQCSTGKVGLKRVQWHLILSLLSEPNHHVVRKLPATNLFQSMAATRYKRERTSLLVILVLCCRAPLGLSASRWGLRQCRIERMVQSLSQSLAYSTQGCAKTCSVLLCSEIIWLYRLGDFLLPDLLPWAPGLVCPVCEGCCTSFLGDLGWPWFHHCVKHTYINVHLCIS